MNRTVLTYGIIAGIIVSALMWMTIGSGNVDFDKGQWIGYTTMVIALSTIFFGVRSYRDKHLGGSIKFGKAFLLGLYITVVASTLYVASWMVMSYAMETDFMDQYYEHTQEKLLSSDLTQEEVDVKLKEISDFSELYKNPVVKAGVTYMEILPVGLLISLICAAMLKRSGPIDRSPT